MSRLFAAALASLPAPAVAATNDSGTGWLSWLILGAIVLFIAGIALRMVLAARFPKGYGAWARSRRDSFADNNAQWDRDDERRS